MKSFEKTNPQGAVIEQEITMIVNIFGMKNEIFKVSLTKLFQNYQNMSNQN